MSPIRVAVVADVLLTEMGGVARSVWCLVNELARMPERVDLTLVARSRPAELNGISYSRSFAPKVPKLPGALFALQRPFSLRGYDIVHYIDSRPPFDFPLGSNVKIVTQHGFATLTFSRGKVGRRWYYVDKALLYLAPFADRTFTASESERAELLKRVSIDPSRVVAIHHGVDHDRFFPRPERAAVREEIRTRFGIDGRYVLYVSNHQRKKNTERLIDAFASVADRVDDVSLVMTGWHTAAFRLVLDRIEQLRLQERVHVLGHVPDDALPTLYAGADVFALPSLHEGFGLPVLEAMACATPVVASNVYALPEVCDDAAELVDPYRTEEIATAIVRLLEDPARADELRQRGLARAKEFSWARAADRHAEEYERALASA
jgi:glycosyltransferase involved in cell wall biosynthesis